MPKPTAGGGSSASIGSIWVSEVQLDSARPCGTPEPFRDGGIRNARVHRTDAACGARYWPRRVGPDRARERADVLSPDGAFVYVAAPRAGIAVFLRNSVTGKLTLSSTVQAKDLGPIGSSFGPRAIAVGPGHYTLYVGSDRPDGLDRSTSRKTPMSSRRSRRRARASSWCCRSSRRPCRLACRCSPRPERAGTSRTARPS
jgi:hypothetical protein